MTHTIFVVDDNVFVREALVMLIEVEPDLAICGVAESAAEALDVLLSVEPDLVLTDFSLPGLSGIELIKRLGAVKPEQSVAIFSAHAEPVCAEQALAAGARGFILKEDATTVVAGIRCVLDGEVYVSPALRRATTTAQSLRRTTNSEKSRVSGRRRFDPRGIPLGREGVSHTDL